MLGYAGGISEDPEAPDRPLVGMSLVRVPVRPDAFSTQESREQLQKELDALLRSSNAYLSNEHHSGFETRAIVKEGSLDVATYITSSLDTLLSKPYLKAIGAWLSGYALTSIGLGTSAYTPQATFRALNKLENIIKDQCRFVGQYILHRVSTVRDRNAIHQEARPALIRNLNQLYDALEVCVGSASIMKRSNAMVRARNHIRTLSDTVDRTNDRNALYKLIQPLTARLKAIQPSGIKAGNEADAIQKFNSAREQFLASLKGLI